MLIHTQNSANGSAASLPCSCIYHQMNIENVYMQEISHIMDRLRAARGQGLISLEDRLHERCLNEGTQSTHEFLTELRAHFVQLAPLDANSVLDYLDICIYLTQIESLPTVSRTFAGPVYEFPGEACDFLLKCRFSTNPADGFECQIYFAVFKYSN
ncbi:hypothetical protein EV182_001041 [Spiromyces aspiralis]|uniref:Uncharacterized protein n=1 Tax=Spiromyces aspiralis TaxID=68401 RepID=A0ACC1HHP5_9FUNG|nr:hypothetical protein EV182_001041 [Spiromyces aspiralis]